MKLTGIKGFEWDRGNSRKNEIKHGVTDREAEEIFFNQPILIARDIIHSTLEERFSALGITYSRRLLNVVFTFRNNRIRVISARPMSRKERMVYEKEKIKDSQI